MTVTFVSTSGAPVAQETTIAASRPESQTRVRNIIVPPKGYKRGDSYLLHRHEHQPSEAFVVSLNH